MADKNNQIEGTADSSLRSTASAAQSEFRPTEITMTHELDLTGLSEREAQRLRDRVLNTKRSDLIVNSILGTDPEAARISFLRIRWGKFGEFPQFIRSVMMSREGTEPAQAITKETISRIYTVEAQGESS